MSLESDIRTVLVNASLNVPIFMGPVRAPVGTLIPEVAIFVLRTGGYMPSGYLDGAARNAYKTERVQVRVRGAIEDYSAASTLADAVWAALNYVSITGYVRVYCEQSAPLYMGKDARQCHEFGINILVESGGFSSG